MTDEAMWKRRFFALMLARLSGTVLALLGLATGFSDVFQVGGNRVLGIALIAAGMIELAVLPILLRRSWREP